MAKSIFPNADVAVDSGFDLNAEATAHECLNATSSGSVDNNAQFDTPGIIDVDLEDILDWGVYVSATHWLVALTTNVDAGADDEFYIRCRVTDGTTSTDWVILWQWSVDGQRTQSTRNAAVSGVPPTNANNWRLQIEYDRDKNMGGESWTGTDIEKAYVNVTYTIAPTSEAGNPHGHIYIFD